MGRLTRFAASLVFLSVVVAPASAQQTRTEQIQQGRTEKADHLHPYQPSKIETFLFEVEDHLWVERLFNPPRGVFARVGDLPEGAGFAGGPAYRYSNHTVSFTVSTAISTRRYWELDGTLAFPLLASGRAFVEISGRRRDFPEEDFFGLGPESRRSTRTNYAFRETSIDASGGVSPTAWLSVAGAVEYMTPQLARGRDRRFPSIERLFSDSTAPGLQLQPDFMRVGARATVDYTDRPLGPRSGGRYIVSYDTYSDRDFDRYSFGRWNVDMQQYVPIVRDARTIALRAHVASLTPNEGHEVPFYLQPTLGGAYSLRGLRPYRLRDRNLLLLQAEYRWEVNAFLTGAIFYDAGKVAFRRRDLNLNDLTHDYGIGLRFGWTSGVAMRTEVAFGSGEGTRFVFRFDDVF